MASASLASSSLVASTSAVAVAAAVVAAAEEEEDGSSEGGLPKTHRRLRKGRGKGTRGFHRMSHVIILRNKNLLDSCGMI